MLLKKNRVGEPSIGRSASGALGRQARLLGRRRLSQHAKGQSSPPRSAQLHEIYGFDIAPVKDYSIVKVVISCVFCSFEAKPTLRRPSEPLIGSARWLEPYPGG